MLLYPSRARARVCCSLCSGIIYATLIHSVSAAVADLALPLAIEGLAVTRFC